MIERLYFGCGEVLGHYWWAPGSARPWASQPRPPIDSAGHPEGCPFGYDVDGWLQPADPKQIEGRCRMETRVNATGPWTCIAWWDRSVDTRPASCSVFIAKGAHDFAVMVAMLSESFPWVTLRCKFPLVYVDEPARPRSRR